MLSILRVFGEPALIEVCSVKSKTIHPGCKLRGVANLGEFATDLFFKLNQFYRFGESATYGWKSESQ